MIKNSLFYDCSFDINSLKPDLNALFNSFIVLRPYLEHIFSKIQSNMKWRRNRHKPDFIDFSDLLTLEIAKTIVYIGMASSNTKLIIAIGMTSS